MTSSIQNSDLTSEATTGESKTTPNLAPTQTDQGITNVSNETATTAMPTTEATTTQVENTNAPYDFTDNGIFDFMTPETAIELYQRIHSRGVPDLEWKFYGRRKPDDLSTSDGKSKQCDNIDKTPSKDQQEQDTTGGTLNNTEFDFDESFSELQAETTAISDSLKLKNRPEPGSERKTNLSDIMSDILKETSHTETG